MKKVQLRVQPCLREALGQVVALEIHRDVSDALRDRDAGLREAAPLPGLGGRVVDLEDAQAGRKRVAVGERVEPGAQHDALVDALPHRRTR